MNRLLRNLMLHAAVSVSVACVYGEDFSQFHEFAYQLQEDGTYAICGAYVLPEALDNPDYNPDAGITSMTIPAKKNGIAVTAIRNSDEGYLGSHFLSTLTWNLQSLIIEDSPLELRIDYESMPCSPCYNKVYLGRNISDKDGLGSLGTFTEGGSVIIGDMVTAVNGWLFWNDEGKTGLSSVVFGKNVERIGHDAFAGCSALKNISFPQSLKVIEEGAFNRCGITYLSIPANIMEIEPRAFSSCTALKEVSFEDSDVPLVLYDGQYSFGGSVNCSIFYNCESLDSLYIGRNLMGTNMVLDKGKELTGPPSYEYSPLFNSLYPYLKSVAFGDKVTQISKSMFEGFTVLEKVEFGKGMKEIPQRAFLGCVSLPEIKIPDWITSIGAEAYYMCTGVKSVSIGQSIRTIPSYCFSECSIESLSIPGTVEYVEDHAFSSCSSLKEVRIEESSSTLYLNWDGGWIGNYLTGGAAGNIFQEDPITDIWVGRNCELYSYADTDPESTSHYGTFSEIPTITNIAFGDNVTIIGDKYDCRNLASLEFGSRVEEIRDEAFYDIPLAEIEFPESLKIIGDNVFVECDNIKSLKFGNSLEKIGGQSFSDCDSLEEITLPKSLKRIGAYAFGWCDNIRFVTSHAIEPPFFYEKWSSFGGFSDIVFETALLTVPVGSESAYENAAVWKEFKNRQSGVNEVIEGEISISVEGLDIVFSNTDDVNVEVYTLDGKTVYSGDASRIRVPCHGLYIVKAAGKAYKVNVF